MKNYLLITLGHNSSAIFVDNTSGKQKIIGYEQERLSRIKSDSQFPIDAINEIEHNVHFSKMKGCTILISHWFNTDRKNPVCKYMTESDFDKLESYEPADIKFVSPSFTHHDAHAYSAHAFFKYHKSNIKAPVHTLVVDGFGNDEEVLSLYVSVNNEQPKLIHRVYGYHFSLGLFYQYATAFVGMKENQDEYKFLGYEAHIDEFLSNDKIATLDKRVESFVEYLLESWNLSTDKPEACCHGLIDFEKLQDVRGFLNSIFESVLAAVGIEKECCHSKEARCVIAYFIQSVCENALSEFIAGYGVNNLVVAGGTFYNVKLNNRLLTETNGVFCAMPLAGDQGAAIGMYEAEDKKDAPAFSFDTLSWGKRRLYNFDKYTRDNVHYYRIQEDDDELAFVIAEEIATRISNGKLVNVVFGNMEFGPRALGNTSTLFLPTVKNTADNNYMNKRNEVMPCAPICTYSAASELFDEQELSRVVGSDRFMICTHNYKKPFSNQYGGVMHHKTMSDDTYTGRPQIVRPGTFIDMILRLVNETTDIKCLVNTSFNAHGNPIVFDTKDIIDNFNFQCEHAHPGHEPELFVVKLYE